MYNFQRKSLVMFSLTSLVLLLLLAACGSAGGTTTGGSGATGSTPLPIPTQTYSAANGCPSNVVMTTDSSKPTRTIQLADAKAPIVVHNGDTLEIRLPFGSQWSGPTISQGVLQLQGPAGYALKSDKVCVWSYVAKGTGTTTLDFSKRALCKPGQFCPMYILKMPFTIEVKK
jgi:ABC-type Fe3+-hydroxamate transport system substrate-binding protein